jgi:hypothetical protein
VASTSRAALRDALDQITAGRIGELLLAVIALISVGLGTLVDPIAGALFAGGMFVLLVALAVYVLRQRANFDGPYRVLSSRCIWDLQDPDGRDAIVTKTLEVEFNYEVIALSERAWGDGSQFAEYECEYGMPLEPTIRDGPVEYMLIALEAPRKRGEQAKLVSRRTVRDAFVEDTEWVEYDLRQKSRSSGIEVRFPAGRAPEKVKLRRREDGATEDVTDMLEDSGNRKVLRVEVRRPPKGARLKLSWDWRV